MCGVPGCTPALVTAHPSWGLWPELSHNHGIPPLDISAVTCVFVRLPTALWQAQLLLLLCVLFSVAGQPALVCRVSHHVDWCCDLLCGGWWVVSGLRHVGSRYGEGLRCTSWAVQVGRAPEPAGSQPPQSLCFAVDGEAILLAALGRAVSKGCPGSSVGVQAGVWGEPAPVLRGRQPPGSTVTEFPWATLHGYLTGAPAGMVGPHMAGVLRAGGQLRWGQWRKVSPGGD